MNCYLIQDIIKNTFKVYYGDLKIPQIIQDVLKLDNEDIVIEISSNFCKIYIKVKNTGYIYNSVSKQHVFTISRVDLITENKSHHVGNAGDTDLQRELKMAIQKRREKMYPDDFS